MNWRFSIIDRNNVTHYIEEPVGWDANVCELMRDAEWHGINFEYSGETLAFYDKSMRLIENEYTLFGAEGKMTLVMEEDCGAGYEEYNRGSLMFKNYEKICGDECYVKITIETVSEVKDLRSRLNQKVNLDTDKAFDETTTLPPYSKLGFELTLPSKAIAIKDYAVNDTDIEEVFNGYLGAPADPPGGNVPWNLNYMQINLAMYEKAGEIGSFAFQTPKTDTVPISGHLGGAYYYPSYQVGPVTVISPWISDKVNNTVMGTGFLPNELNPTTLNLYEGSNNYNDYSNPVQISYHLKGRVEVQQCNLGGMYLYFLRLKDRPNKANNGDELADYDIIQRSTIRPFTNVLGGGSGQGSIIPFDFSYTDNAFQLNKKDKLFFFISLIERKTQSMIDAINGNLSVYAFKLLTYKDSFFKIANLSKTKPTTARSYLIHEVFSRVTEAITNDQVRAYSEYFGRTDSQPYAYTSDGCGSLEAITDGIRIRQQENRIAGKPSLLNVSLQDVFEGLNPIHNIGAGLEPDTQRSGFNRLRVEPWNYFYKNDVILTCTGVDKITTTLHEKDVYSAFQMGYAKWEAEQYTGLDEFLTKRSYRSTFNIISNTLTKLSKFIASGYALEVTRRIGDNNSKDWRYDKDVFIICCKRSGQNIVVEQGNVSNAENIIDPNSIYNYRISPIRNAMRWANKLLISYRQFTNSAKFIFTDGDANYYAKGKQTDTNCIIEKNAIAENDEINPSIFQNELVAKPFLRAERVNFTYPISSKEFKLIKNNPYSLIAYSSNCGDGYGWISNLKYKPEQGTAEFTLIPKA